MLFIVLGVLLLGMKWAEFGPVAAWPWWVVLAPFGCAALWWWWADSSGYTKRREMDKMEDRKVNRRRSALEALGIDPRAKQRNDRKAEAFRKSRAFQISKIEGKREELRRKQKEIVTHGSRFMDSSQMVGGDSEGDTEPPKKR